MRSIGSSGEASPEPGLDVHEWDSRWASIENDLADDPTAALSLYVDLLEVVLRASGYRLDDPVERAGDEPEVVRTFLAARETSQRADGEASRGDVETAIDDLRSVLDALLAELR